MIYELFNLLLLRYCQNDLFYKQESILHCDGIWLHALKYEYQNQWSFETSWPDWAQHFNTINNHKETI